MWCRLECVLVWCRLECECGADWSVSVVQTGVCVSVVQTGV